MVGAQFFLALSCGLLGLTAPTVLGVLARISLALFQRDCQRPQPVRDQTYPVWSGRLRRQPRPMLDLLLKRCSPA